MNKSAAASRATAAAPIAMPAIAPPDSPELPWDAAAAAAAVVVADATATVVELDDGADVELGADEVVLEKGLFSSAGHG